MSGTDVLAQRLFQYGNVLFSFSAGTNILMPSFSFLELHNTNRAATLSGKLTFPEISFLCHFQIMTLYFISPAARHTIISPIKINSISVTLPLKVI